MNFSKNAITEKTSAADWGKIGLLSVLSGVLGGLVGGAFVQTLTWASSTRLQYPWLLFLLPLGGIATVLLFRLCKLGDHGGVNEIIKNIETGTPARSPAAPLIFVCTALTHLFGGSAGKEGAALQLGGAGAAALANPFKLRSDLNATVLMCGMCAVFAGVFGTPLTAVVFVLEFRAAGRKMLSAALPCLLSAVLANRVAPLTGGQNEVFHLPETIGYDLSTIATVIVLALCVSLAGMLMCFVFGKSKRMSGKLFPNPLVRIAAGAILVILLTWLTGDMRYNGSGMEMAVTAIEGQANWFDFILKMIFTAVTVSAGFKGGEIVPTFCIGATFGCVMGGLLGLNPSFAAAIGLIALFSYATNSLFGAVLLGFELFGAGALPYFILVCLVSVALSGEHGLFRGRFFRSPLLILKEKHKPAE